MKKLLIPAFVCTAAMFIACGDDSSSTSSEVVESSSSGTNSEDSGEEIFGSGNGLDCISIKDTTTKFWYSYEGPASALTVTKYEYPIENKEAVENCFDIFADKTDEKLDCDSVMTTIITTINPSQTMTYDALKSLWEKECKSLF